jgi:molybdate transport system regulatory protein
MTKTTQSAADSPGDHPAEGDRAGGPLTGLDAEGGRRTAGDSAGEHHRAHGGSRAHNPSGRLWEQSGGGGTAARPEPASSLPPASVPLEVRPAQRIWLQEKGVRLFGPGTNELLRRVDATGSLNRAAKDMAMSYSKAWRIVHEVEQRLGLELFARRTGGTGGGGSCLTDQGRLLLRRFDALSQAADEALDELFATHFGDLFPAAPGAEAGQLPPGVGPPSE